MDISDKELRERLLKFIDKVPPVTGSTRKVLEVKLQKLESQAFADVEDNYSIVESELVNEAVVSNAPSKQSRNLYSSTQSSQSSSTTPEKTSRPHSKSPKIISTDTESNELPSRSPIIETNDFRIRHFPATPLPDYAGGIPVFRRRSLARDQIPNPYEAFSVRSPRLNAEFEADRILSRATNFKFVPYTSSSQKGKSELSGFYKVGNVCSSVLNSLFGLLIMPFICILSVLGRLSTPSWRCLLFLLAVCVVSGLALLCFYMDPFYRNPVADFAAQFSPHSTPSA